MQNLESFVAVLLALKPFLAPPGYDPAAAAAAGGAGEAAPKLAALGLVNPPAAAITAAVSLRRLHCLLVFGGSQAGGLLQHASCARDRH